MVFPAQSLPRTPIRGGNPGGAWRMFYPGQADFEKALVVQGYLLYI